MTDSRDETTAARSADGGETQAGAAENAPANDAAEAAELKDRLLRALAEMENLRRRTEKEIVEARAYGIAAFARDVLGVADNMRRALDAAESGQGEVEARLNALIEGIELTDRELLKTLEKHGVVRIEPQGQKFDPHFHQAMYELPDPSVPQGTVVQVVQTGYTIGERVLRPALVAVAKGGPKTPVEQPSSGAQDSDPVAPSAGEPS